MNNFNIKRFGNLLRWTAINNKIEYITIIGVMFFVYNVIEWFPFIINPHRMESHLRFDDLPAVFCTAIFTIASCVAACYIFKNVQSKKQRINYLMLPASNLEKVLARHAYLAVVIIGMAVAFFLADTIRMGIFHLLFGKTLYCGTSIWMKSIIDRSNFYYMDTIYSVFYWLSNIVWCFWIISIFILGGTLFNKLKLILSGVLYFGIISIYMVAKNIFYQVATNGDKIYINGTLANDCIPYYSFIWFTILLILVILNYWLSYRIFARMDVAPKKWINI